MGCLLSCIQRKGKDTQFDELLKETETEVVNAVADLPNIGEVKVTDRGFVFVDISDEYIHRSVKVLQDLGYEFEPPEYFGGDGSIGSSGAHITLLNEEEHTDLVKRFEGEDKPAAQLEKLEGKLRIGQEINFKQGQCIVVAKEQWGLSNKRADLYVLQVEAPNLTRIRSDCQLPQVKYPFHITLAIRFRSRRQGCCH